MTDIDYNVTEESIARSREARQLERDKCMLENPNMMIDEDGRTFRIEDPTPQ